MGTGAGGGPSRAPFWPQSLGEVQQLQKTLMSPAEAAGFLHGSRDSGGSSKASSCDTDDFVMVPAQFAGQLPRLPWARIERECPVPCGPGLCHFRVPRKGWGREAAHMAGKKPGFLQPPGISGGC